MGAVGLGPPLQPRHYRHQIHRFAYFNLDRSNDQSNQQNNDQNNGGIIRNLGEAGIAIQAVAPLQANQQVFLRFELVNPRVRVAAVGRVAWADPAGQAGVEFLALPPRALRQLKEWMFLQLLTTSAQAIGDLNFARSKSGEETTELLFSTAPRPAIHLEPEVAPAVLDGKDRQKLHLTWFPLALSKHVLSLLVDGLVLLSAVLLFAVICMAMTGIVPAWPVALLLGFGTVGIFTAVYRLLFWFWIGCTPGAWLTRRPGDPCDGVFREAEERPRFR
jgi:hypothetical protein